ncbi:calmodulin-like [Dendronephthya gigantea]|uniref:calmodulin-like n=1 Tax=Dendronephthya gigantea TaxID=151771 RepID=UPI00106C32FC|nr:calmodulin-like [Dendronephthya gigantea]
MPVEPGEGMKLLTEEQLEEYRDAFDVFDRDGNGKVSSDELGPLMRSLGSNPKDEHLQDLINEVDYDGDGVLNFTEFVDLMVNDKPEIEMDLELIEAFHAFDTEDTGFINSADLREAFQRMDEPQGDVEDIIDATNVRVDRKVTYDEFVALTVILKSEK